MELIRMRRDDIHVDPDSYITCGFSSGGYLVCLWSTEKGYRSFGIAKPKASFPVYPATSYRLLDDEECEERVLYVRFLIGCTYGLRHAKAALRYRSMLRAFRRQRSFFGE